VRVLFVSTWGSSCGIATYTEELVAGSKDLWDSCVASPAELGSGIRETPPVPSRQYWHHTSPILGQQLLQAVEDFQPDVVHIQHEPGLFSPLDVFISTVRALKRRIPTVITMHRTEWLGGWESTAWVQDLGRYVDRIIVHTPEAWSSVTLFAPNTVCIPHGTAPLAAGLRERGLKILNAPPNLARLLSGEKRPVVCLIHGFLHHNKNVLYTIRAIAMAEARRLCDPIVLIITGQAQEAFLPYLHKMLDITRLTVRTLVYPSFVKTCDVSNIFALADFGVLNTAKDLLATSGAVHVYAYNGVPLAVANRSIYQEAIRGGAVAFDVLQEDAYNRPSLQPFDGSTPTDSAVDVVAALASNPALRAYVRSSMVNWAKQTQWPIIARQHLALYEQVIAERGDHGKENGV